MNRPQLITPPGPSAADPAATLQTSLANPLLARPLLPGLADTTGHQPDLLRRTGDGTLQPADRELVERFELALTAPPMEPPPARQPMPSLAADSTMAVAPAPTVPRPQAAEPQPLLGHDSRPTHGQLQPVTAPPVPAVPSTPAAVVASEPQTASALPEAAPPRLQPRAGPLHDIPVRAAAPKAPPAAQPMPAVMAAPTVMVSPAPIATILQAAPQEVPTALRLAAQPPAAAPPLHAPSRRLPPPAFEAAAAPTTQPKALPIPDVAVAPAVMAAPAPVPAPITTLPQASPLQRPPRLAPLHDGPAQQTTTALAPTPVEPQAVPTAPQIAALPPAAAPLHAPPRSLSAPAPEPAAAPTTQLETRPIPNVTVAPSLMAAPALAPIATLPQASQPQRPPGLAPLHDGPAQQTPPTLAPTPVESQPVPTAPRLATRPSAGEPEQARDNDNDDEHTHPEPATLQPPTIVLAPWLAPAAPPLPVAAPAQTPQAPVDVSLRDRLIDTVQQLLVRAATHDTPAQVHLVLQDSLLPGTVIQLQQVGAQLQVSFECTAQASRQRLERSLPVLAQSLARRLGRDVQVEVHDDTGDALPPVHARAQAQESAL